jgi:hypothetical protein
MLWNKKKKKKKHSAGIYQKKYLKTERTSTGTVKKRTKLKQNTVK